MQRAIADAVNDLVALLDQAIDELEAIHPEGTDPRASIHSVIRRLNQRCDDVLIRSNGPHTSAGAPDRWTRSSARSSR